MSTQKRILNARKRAAKQLEKQYISSESEADNVDPRDYFTLKMRSVAQSKKEKEHEKDDDPVALLQSYNHDNYKQQLDVIKQYVENQKPFQYQNLELDKFIQLGANICFYGFGSKKKFMMDLARKYYSESYVWEVKGYLLTIHVKKIYNNFGDFLVKAGLTSEISKITQNDQLEEYRTCLQKYSRKASSKPIVVVFHCLDGNNFMDVEAQKSLASLLSLPGIRVLSSIDSIKMPIHWHPRVKESLKFLFFQVDTKVPNIEQQKYKPVTTERTYAVQQSLMNICQCLNNNQKKILKILAKNELQNQNREHQINYTISELLQICIDEVILQSDSQLRENLLELLDHKVLTQKMDDTKNRKVVCLKYEKKLLEKILDLKSD